MQRLMLSTSAVALAVGLATEVGAAEWEVRVGGFMEQYVGYADVDVDGFVGEDFDGVDNKADSEIHFLPSITLDNGLKIGLDIQLEGAASDLGGTPDTIDESYLFIRGAFGEILLGSENSAGYKMTFAAPDVTFINVNSGSTTLFVPFSGTVSNIQGGNLLTLNVGDDVFRRTLGTTFIENDGNNDSQRFTYFTPRFAGFQFGFSYARDGNQGQMSQLNLNSANGASFPANALNNIFDLGANYVNSFGGFDVAVSGRWGIASDDRAPVANTDIGEEPQIWSAGLNLGYAGVAIGGSFAEQNDSGTEDGRVFDAGISYETGPWGFSFTYINGENVDDENAFIGADEKLQQYLVGITYLLAQGVSLDAYGVYVDFDEEVGDNVAGFGVVNPGGDDVDAFIIGTGIKVSF